MQITVEPVASPALLVVVGSRRRRATGLDEFIDLLAAANCATKRQPSCAAAAAAAAVSFALQRCARRSVPPSHRFPLSSSPPTASPIKFIFR